MSYEFLRQYWWCLIALLGGLLVALMFVQGGNAHLGNRSLNDTQRRMILNATGRKWELTFTTLVTFGGAFFASFPLFYSTSFGGAYWVWVLLLISFVFQAVAYEFQHKKGNLLGEKGFRIALMVNGILAPFLVGTAVGTFFTGSDFTVDKLAITDPSGPVISTWGNGWHGLEALGDYHAVLLGCTLMVLATILGSLYILHSVDDTEIHGSMRPVVLVMLLAGVVLVLVGIWKGAFTKSRNGFWFTAPGTVLVVMSVFFLAGFNGTAYYPSKTDLQSSLTLANSSSSYFTLKVMSYVSLLIPFVVAYIAFAWRAMDRKDITPEEIDGTMDKY